MISTNDPHDVCVCTPALMSFTVATAVGGQRDVKQGSQLLVSFDVTRPLKLQVVDLDAEGSTEIGSIMLQSFAQLKELFSPDPIYVARSNRLNELKSTYEARMKVMLESGMAMKSLQVFKELHDAVKRYKRMMTENVKELT